MKTFSRRQLQRFLWLSGGVGWCAAIALWVGISLRPGLQVTEIALNTEASNLKSTPVSAPSLVSWGDIPWKKRLRPDPPPPVNTTPVVTKPMPVTNILPPGLRLLGTIIEADQRWAVLQTGPQSVEVRRANDLLGGAVAGGQLETIADHEVQIRFQNQVYILKLDVPAKGLRVVPSPGNSVQREKP